MVREAPNNGRQTGGATSLLILPDGRRGIKRRRSKVAATGRPFYTPDGSVVTTSERGREGCRPVRTSDGLPPGWPCTPTRCPPSPTGECAARHEGPIPSARCPPRTPSANSGHPAFLRTYSYSFMMPHLLVKQFPVSVLHRLLFIYYFILFYF